MLREQWQRARSILDRALELAPADRDAFVVAECGEDRELWREVDSLLALESRAHLEPPSPSLLANAALRAVPRAATPHRIGPYELVEQIGAGGMGSVWRARRVEGFDQIVAIKLIKRGMDTDEVLRRFETERTVLATLQHDGIARLFDGGATEGGVPYLVMEYVDGLPIDRYCSSRELSVREKLGIVLSVCDAVQFAHEHLVVHRDLKPSNILVTQAGVPKLLDFGIAKVLSEGGAERTAERTSTGLRVLTPAYASPEQLRGESLTTQSDVFSLGLVLWELLVGRRAFERDRSPDSQPTRASVAFASTSGSKRRARQLTGDLDTILARACHADLTRRYSSVEAFAGDLRLYLADQPVRAQRDSLAYRVSKFTRRNKLLVAALAVVLVALATATAVSTSMFLRTLEARNREREQGELAQRRFDQTRKLATTFLFDVHDSIEKLSGATEARATLLTTALATLDQLSSERSDQADLNLELFGAYMRLANIYENGSSASLARPVEAFAALEKARAIAERFAPDSAERSRLLGIVEYEEGDAEFARGLFEAADGHYSRSAELLASLPRESHTRDSWKELGSAFTRLAMIARKTGRRAEAACWLDLAVGHHQAIAAESNEESDRYDVAVVLQERGRVNDESGDLDGAIEAKRASLTILEDRLRAHPEIAACRNSVAQVAASLSRSLSARDRLGEALECSARAADLMRESAYQDLEDGTAARLLQTCLQTLGSTHLSLGQLERACAIFEEAVSLAGLRLDRVQDSGQPIWDRSAALTMQAVAVARMEQWSQSLALADEALAMSEAALQLSVAGLGLAAPSYRLEYAMQVVEALTKSRGPVESATAREVLAFARHMAESARDLLDVYVPAPAEVETHASLVEQSQESLDAITALAARYEAP